MGNEPFYPDEIKISRNTMKLLADSISGYLRLLEKVYVVPDELMPKREVWEKSIRVTKKLIKKLEKGDKGVFKDRDDWNMLD